MSEPAIKSELVSGSDTLYLIFGGIKGGLGMPPFEFYRAAKLITCSKIFLRDLSQAWYQRGLPSLGEDILSIRDYLQHEITQSGARHIRFVGNSMGGFAALLFCALLKCGKAIVFSPQTFVSAEMRSIHQDNRWEQQINQLHKTTTGSEIFDIKPYALKNYPELQASIYVSTDDSLDALHAQEMSDLPNVTIHRVGGGGHEIVKVLRDSGMLDQILRQ